MKQNRFGSGTPLVRRGTFCLAVVAAAQVAGTESDRTLPAAGGLRPGLVLDQTTAAVAKDYLPPEIFAHYEKGEYRNEITDWQPGRTTHGPAFAAQTERNAQTLTVDDLGTIIDKTTGQQPPYIYGTPFPKIDADDPSAGVKVLWNYFYTSSWWNGNSRTLARLLWLNVTGIDREAGQDVLYKFYDGVPPDVRPTDNPNNLLAQFIASTTRPADLNGTVALSWRYRDPQKRDSVWAYVPALRRTRAVSPANRSDGFLGSDMSQDDGQLFDGKPQDFTWKLVGERDMLVFVDPYRLSGDVDMHPLPGGGWRSNLKPVPSFGFEDKSWKGIAWAPVSHKLALRRVSIVEGVPKDKYYLYGKLQLIIDKETWHGAYNRKFGWNGELLNTLQAAGGPAVAAPDGVHFFSAGVGAGEINQVSENIKMTRATGVSIIDNVNDRLVPVDSAMFDYQTLNRFGK